MLPSLAMMSASIIGQPSLAKWFDTVVLPLAIPPVRPNTNIFSSNVSFLLATPPI